MTKHKAYGSISLPQKVFDFLGTPSEAESRVISKRLKSKRKPSSRIWQRDGGQIKIYIGI
jgi:hypothetical protein